MAAVSRRRPFAADCGAAAAAFASRGTSRGPATVFGRAAGDRGEGGGRGGGPVQSIAPEQERSRPSGGEQRDPGSGGERRWDAAVDQRCHGGRGLFSRREGRGSECGGGVLLARGDFFHRRSRRRQQQLTIRGGGGGRSRYRCSPAGSARARPGSTGDDSGDGEGWAEGLGGAEAVGHGAVLAGRGGRGGGDEAGLECEAGWRDVVVEACAGDVVGDALKPRLAAVTGVPAGRQRLVAGGAVVDDGATVGDSDVGVVTGTRSKARTVYLWPAPA